MSSLNVGKTGIILIKEVTVMVASLTVPQNTIHDVSKHAIITIVGKGLVLTPRTAGSQREF